MTALYELRSRRCVLRPISIADAASLHALWTTAGVRRFLWDDDIVPPTRTQTAIEQNAQLFAQRRFGLWGVRLASSPDLVGFAGLWPFRDPPVHELLYGIAGDLWGHGLAVEASEAVLEYCQRQLHMTLVRASTDAGNSASIRVLEKLRFAQVRRETIDGLDTLFFERPLDQRGTV
jgi:RimJ/RimL family protein N-acetyltransferase